MPPYRRLVVLLAAAAVACAAPAPRAAAPPALPSPSISTTPTASSAPRVAVTRPKVTARPRHRPPARDPLTGLAPRTAPVVVIKVDNATTARPYQRGLGAAAVVYQELVESGATRFAAVYDNASSQEVGPIRSVRETDIALLGAYGRVTVGFSGANKGVMRSFNRAVRAGRLLDASYDTLPGVYREGVRRVDAHNFFSTPAQLAHVRHGVAARYVGFHFARLPRGAGRAAAGASIRFSEFSRVTVRYRRRTGHWSVLQDGHPLAAVAPANVIIQTVRVTGSRYVDVLGSPTPYTVTVGHGSVVLLRDGRLIRGTWRRLASRTGTRFLDDKGRDLPMKPGPTWILLQPKGQRTAFF